MITNKYSAKSILITGCSSGIGLCAALTLQQRGYQVIASVRSASAIEGLKSQGLKHVVHLDLADSDSIDSGLAATLDICQGKLFALFNNGAYGQPGAVEDLSREALRRQFETNVFGTHDLTVKTLPHLIAYGKGGEGPARIVQNSSILGFMAMPMRGAYNASKFALEGLSDTLRLELSETPVKVIIIEPGPIVSNFRKNALRALEANVDFAKSRHQMRYENALARLQKTGPSSRFTLPAEAVVAQLVRALEAQRPKPRYRVTLPTKLFAQLRHVIPTALLDRLLIRIAKAEG